MLFDRMCCEPPRTVKPAGVARATKQLKESVAIACSAVTKAWTLPQRASTPGHFSGCDEKIIYNSVGKLCKTVHDAGRAMAMLNKHGRTARTMLDDGLGPIRTIIFPKSRSPQ
jgi:hypothetical protein